MVVAVEKRLSTMEDAVIRRAFPCSCSCPRKTLSCPSSHCPTMTGCGVTGRGTSGTLRSVLSELVREEGEEDQAREGEEELGVPPL